MAGLPPASPAVASNLPSRLTAATVAGASSAAPERTGCGGVELPNGTDAVGAAGGGLVTAWMNSHRLGRCGEAFDFYDRLTAGHVPDAQRLVGAATDEPRAIQLEAQAGDRAGMTGERLGHCSRRDVEHLDRPFGGGNRQQLLIGTQGDSGRRAR